MSNEIVYEDTSGQNELAMDMFQVSDCCRACLRIESPLTPTVNQDTDSIKFCDKLLACVSEVVNCLVVASILR